MSVAGIPIRIHFTFLLFLVWVALTNTQGFIWMALVLSVFACVLLHELGHALVAKRFGIETRDITLYPIGGVAMLSGRPRPKQELWIALAGPAVNVAISIGILLGMAVGARGVPEFGGSGGHVSFFEALLIANVSLAVFNMIPAFPMDGGRVLRALLGLRMPVVRATQIAGTVGQGLAILFGLFGLFTGGPILMLIAFFVFLGAGQEVESSLTRSFMLGHPLRDAMQMRYRTIASGESLDTAAKMLLSGSQHDFPVVAGEEVVGLLTRTDIANGLASEGPTGYVAGHMQRDVKTAHPNLPLEMALDMFGEDSSPIVVMEDGKMVGLLTSENLAEFVMLEHARRQSSHSYGYTA